MTRKMRVEHGKLTWYGVYPLVALVETECLVSIPRCRKRAPSVCMQVMMKWARTRCEE
jgi:hypothetical protein